MKPLNVGDAIDLPAAHPWYNSSWLTSFVRAKAWLRVHQPDRLEDFERSFDVLRTDPSFETRHLRDALSKEDHARLKALTATTWETKLEKHEVLGFGRLIVRGATPCTELQERLTDRISELVNEDVEPCYNFLSLYNNLGVCAVHMDTPAAKWTFDYCIEQSAPWPIYLSQVRPWPDAWHPSIVDWERAIRDDPENAFTAFTLREGEALLFGGSSQWHYRDRIAQKSANNFCHLLFLHYVPKGTRHLVDPSAWAEHFGVAELRDVIDDPEPLDPNVIG